MIRFFDLVFAIFGLFFLSPIIIILIFLGWIKFKSPIFIQPRLGFKQKSFRLVKFRTMPLNTVSAATHLININSINKYGRFLRKIKLDEILQFYNVLVGEMSIVGPRPCLLNQKKLISERKKRQVFRVKPGITGLSQLKGITMKTVTLLAKSDRKMINQMNLYNYFYYIFMTLFVLLKRK